MSDQQKTTIFEPTADQLLFANAYIKSVGNITEAFEDMGKDRTVYYTDWKKQEGFSQWLSEYVKTEVLKHVGKWYLILEKYAEKGSFNHIDRLLEIAKEFTPSPSILVFPQKTMIFRDIDDRADSLHDQEGSEGHRTQEQI